jgi:flagellin
VDVAQESSILARNQILQQAASSMLVQANQSPQIALNLLR